jgi:hypothetical protein
MEQKDYISPYNNIEPMLCEIMASQSAWRAG